MHERDRNACLKTIKAYSRASFFMTQTPKNINLKHKMAIRWRKQMNIFAYVNALCSQI